MIKLNHSFHKRLVGLNTTHKGGIGYEMTANIVKFVNPNKMFDEKTKNKIVIKLEYIKKLKKIILKNIILICKSTMIGNYGIKEEPSQIDNPTEQKI